MKKINIYFAKFELYIKQWREHLPIISIILFLIVLVLTGVTIYIFVSPVSKLALVKDTNAKFEEFNKEFAVSQKISYPDSASFRLIDDNNLFSSRRADWEIAPSPSKSAPKSAPQPIPEPIKKVVKKKKPKIKADKIKLSAILMFGETRVALIGNLGKDKNKVKYVYVKKGDDIMGYNVKSIEPNKLIVEWDKEETEIKLYK